MYNLLKLEITSLSCEKDFLLSSLDEIDALIFKKQEESGLHGADPNLKRCSPPDESLSAKKRKIEKELLDSAQVPIPEVKKEDTVVMYTFFDYRHGLLGSRGILYLLLLISVRLYDCDCMFILGSSETIF